MTRTHTLAAGLSGIALAAGAASAQLLVNPGFELNDQTMETDDVVGFEEFGPTFVNQALPRTGSNSLKAFGEGGVFQDFAVSPGDTAAASAFAANPEFDALGDDQIAAVNIEFFDAGGGLLERLSTTIIDGTNSPADSGFAFGEVSGVAPAGSATARFVLVTGAFFDVDGDGGTLEGGGAPFFDDANFSITPIPEPAAAGLLAVAGLGLLGRRSRR